MVSRGLSRRTLFKLAGAAGLPLSGLLSSAARAADASTLTIAYNVNLPSFDPTVGLSAVNPTIQSIYQSIFDTYISQAPDLSFKPGLLTKWGWSADQTKVTMEVRQGATWHDGSPVTPDDVVWSLTRAADPKGGNPIQFVWSKIGNYKVDGNTITADVLEFEPTLFKWMAFLTGYVLPKAYYEKVGADGFEKAPIGSGPYKVDAFERNAFLRLKAHPGYWGPKPAFETVVFKFVTDSTSRVAEIESGGSDLTFEIPYEEFDRLKAKPGLAGQTEPVSDIAMIFITDIDPMLDRNVRLAANHAIDKKAIVEKLLKGYGVPISTLEAPGYASANSVFVDDPLRPGERLYRSGDVARYLPGGGIQLVGRADDQIKIRGFRIEPAEVEAALQTVPGVGQAAVLAFGDAAQRYLTAFVTRDRSDLTEMSIRTALAARLPEPMVPARVVVLAAMPRLPNGKIDRRVLVEPERSSNERSAAIAETVPRTALETLLAQTLAVLLERDSVEIDSSLFELGGDSLLVIRLASRVRDLLRIEVLPGLIFEHPSVADLAKALGAQHANPELLEQTAKLRLKLDAMDPAERARIEALAREQMQSR